METGWLSAGLEVLEDDDSIGLQSSLLVCLNGRNSNLWSKWTKSRVEGEQQLPACNDNTPDNSSTGGETQVSECLPLQSTLPTNLENGKQLEH